ncbi:MAG: hypothetical protein ATN35_06015 [Epulopiscium sp. Nele67-Bin004]|nr:MAG: hypothetical protein ATN35_06015 [Epulopiscium sp. Nele67-Bin004]
MDDIFYCTGNKITLNDIKELAEQVNVKRTFITQSLDALEIEYLNGIYTQWIQMDMDDIESVDRKDLMDNNISIIFCISHHPKQVKFILPHLNKVLQTYGGWIGSDSGGFHPRINAHNIHKLLD